MDEELFRKYAELKRQIAGLDEELRGLQPKITEELKHLRDTRLKTSFGEFDIKRKANWTYSVVVQRLEEQLKSQQQVEKDNGTATAKYTEFVWFKAAMEN